MAESSLTRLSGFLAEAVWKKFDDENGEYFNRISTEVEMIMNLFAVWDNLNDDKTFGREIDEKFFDVLWRKLKSEGASLSGELSIKDLHLKLLNLFVMPETIDVELCLTYKVKVESVEFEFDCMLNEYDIINHSIMLISGGEYIDDIWDYYFQRTPCAVI
jgi:hypothetical protein